MKIEGLSNLTSQGYASEAKGSRAAFEAAKSGSANASSGALNADNSADNSSVDAKNAAMASANNLSAAVDELNDEMSSRDVSLRFRVDQDSEDVIVSVVDQESDEVIREIPPEEVVRMRERIKEMAGLLLEETA